jgi:hypothetical protein
VWSYLSVLMRTLPHRPWQTVCPSKTTTYSRTQPPRHRRHLLTSCLQVARSTRVKSHPRVKATERIEQVLPLTLLHKAYRPR